MSSIQAKLQSGVATVTKSKYNFDTKITSSAPSRPTKRKAEVMVLSDSDDDEPTPQPKRRQPVPHSTYSAPPPQKAVKPWDQDHTKKKLPSNAHSSSSVPKTQGKLTADLVSLSKQQRMILEVVMEGKNVFFTGSAGMYPSLTSTPRFNQSLV